MARKKTLLTGGAVVFLLIFVGITLALRFDLSALPEPGPLEVALATRARRLLVARSSRQGVPPQPAASADGLAEGKTRYGVECAACHGMDGRGLTDNGRWMYPRAADLASRPVQEYSDAELFWIVKNGIRLSGMPAFGKVESDERMWRIVQYLRSLRGGPLSVSDGSETHTAHLRLYLAALHTLGERRGLSAGNLSGTAESCKVGPRFTMGAVCWPSM